MNPASLPSGHPLIHKLERLVRLSPEERRAVEGLLFQVRSFEPRRDVTHDEAPTQCCLVLTGWLCRYKMVDEGRRQIMALHLPGEIPDQQGLYLPTMDYSLCTLTMSTLAFIPHEGLRSVLSAYPRLGTALWRDVLVEGAILRQWVIGMGQRSAPGRIAHLFCELYARLEALGLAANHRYELPCTQYDLGDIFGLSTVHINRLLQDLRSAHLIELKGRSLALPDWDRLVHFAEFDPTYLFLSFRPAG
jgi:CRP-like cAMP-binding protein